MRKDRSRAVGGTGLGLSIVKHVVLAHGGQVTVESQPGRGAAFRLRDPAALPEAAGRLGGAVREDRVMVAAEGGTAAARVAALSALLGG